MRYRDPVRYGAWLDGMEARRHPDGAAVVLAHALNTVLDDAHGFDADDYDQPDPGDPDDDDPDGDGPDGDDPSGEADDAAAAPLMPRAVAEGPDLTIPPEQVPVPATIPPELHDLWRGLRGHFRRDDEEEEPDPTIADWRDPVTVRRSRKAPQGPS